MDTGDPQTQFGLLRAYLGMPGSVLQALDRAAFGGSGTRGEGEIGMWGSGEQWWGDPNAWFNVQAPGPLDW